MFFNLAHQRFEGCIKNFKPCQSCWSQGPSKTWSEINGQKIRFGKTLSDVRNPNSATQAGCRTLTIYFDNLAGLVYLGLQFHIDWSNQLDNNLNQESWHTFQRKSEDIGCVEPFLLKKLMCAKDWDVQ